MLRFVRSFSVVVVFFLGAVASSAQPASIKDTASLRHFLDSTANELLDEGLAMDKDSVYVNAEVKKLLLDASYRAAVYPANYNWKQVVELMNTMELKKAFWYIINIYNTDVTTRKIVIQTLVAYDKLIDMEKVLTNSFYTYALVDPEITTVTAGRPTVKYPAVLEKKFAALKEIIRIVLYNRTAS